MILLLDNFDSFTYNLRDYLEQCGKKVVVHTNIEELNVITEKQYEGVVLSPGPKTPAESGNLMKVIDHYHNRLPVMGICLGHQALGEYFGCELVKATKPMHGKISTVKHLDHPMFSGIPLQFEACRYHSLLLKNLDESILEVTAYSSEDEIMAFAHRQLPLWAMQFHPEAILTPHGFKMIQNWVNSLVTTL